MTEQRVFNVMVMVTPAEDLPQQWVAHVLDFDVITQGDSPQAAAQMAYEAAMMVVCDDLNDGHDPHARSAPQEYWSRLYAMIHGARSVEVGDVDPNDRNKAYVFFLDLRIGREGDGPRSARLRATLANEQACA